ncbi:MAG: ABC transporter ATP-binding protein [Pseudomonadota bacterium]|nr:ABC transporter ATP-binding protein [Pseudomonadota bacterium]
MTAPLVSIRGLTRVYGEGDATVRALAGVDLDVQRGEFVSLMGPSGSGKSTLLNTIGCLDMPTAGSYRLRGAEVTTLTHAQRALLRRQWLGYIFQGFHLLPRSTALENVELPLVYRGVGAGERRDRALESLRDVGLGHRVGHYPSELSGGQQQRVAIARALVIRPDLLLADEPTGNLDSKTSHEVMHLLRELSSERGITILMVTHEPEMAAYTPRVVTFQDGCIAKDERAA